MMVFRTLRGPFNMGNIVLLTCGLMFVAASMKEEATQLLRPIAKPGHIEEPLITERLITESVPKHCTFSSGYVRKIRGYTEGDNLGKTNTENECASLVMAQNPGATGATWRRYSKTCWAEFGDRIFREIGKIRGIRACLFTSETVTTSYKWVDLGAGCCSDRSNNALFTDAVDDLDACKQKCLDYGGKFVEYGWKDSNWCYVVSADAGCENLHNGQNDCGSVGNDGVHSFEAIEFVETEGTEYINTPNTYCRYRTSPEFNYLPEIEYWNLELALEACTADAECKALSDAFCDGTGIYICNVLGSSFSLRDSSSGSCTWLKEPSYSLGNKGKEGCSQGVSIKDEATCRIACSKLGLPLKQISHGFFCYKDSKGDCYQNGKNGGGASFICKDVNTYSD